jgi:hypothetical protein
MLTLQSKKQPRRSKSDQQGELLIEQNKRCIICTELKELSQFDLSARGVDGHRRECKECRKRQRRLISSTDYEALLTSQGGKCAICGVAESDYSKRFSVDHDHDNPDEPARGLLCQHCNTLIGMAEEDIAILTQAIGYLNHHNAKII